MSSIYQIHFRINSHRSCDPTKKSGISLYKKLIWNLNQKMIFFIFLISQNFLNAFNEDLSAVHYSIVTPGIDEELEPGM